MLTRVVLLGLLMSSFLSTRARADALFVEAGVTQRVPSGIVSPVPGATLRAAFVSPLAGFDRSFLGLEAGFSDPSNTSGWLALEGGLWRAFGDTTRPAPFVGAHLSGGFLRGPSGDTLFFGARLGTGVLVPLGAAQFVLGLWGVANDAGPGLSLTVGCLLPPDR